MHGLLDQASRGEWGAGAVRAGAGRQEAEGQGEEVVTNFALLAAQLAAAAPVPFDALTLERARELDGQPVVVTFTASRPAYTWGEGKALVTVAGPAHGDGFERSAVLKGDRLKDADVGAKLRVSGRLRVIRHPAAEIGDATFGAFTEVRVDE